VKVPTVSRETVDSRAEAQNFKPGEAATLCVGKYLLSWALICSEYLSSASYLSEIL